MSLPGYEPFLAAYHAAFEAEIRKMIAVLPFDAGARLADMGSGDGFFAGLLAERLSRLGALTCVDASEEYLESARRRLTHHPLRERIAFQAADVRFLPFQSGAFQFIWCAQSLYSFSDPVACIAEMARTLAPSGTLAVLENDTAHQVLLPWPPEVEFALRAAELAGFRARAAQADKFYVGRGLSAVLEKAGLKPRVKRTFAWDRLAPFDPDTRRFLDLYLADLRDRTGPFLSATDRAVCEPYLDPMSDRYVLNRPACNATVIDHVMWGSRG
jgi:SAM-dependent methyltransferase